MSSFITLDAESHTNGRVAYLVSRMLKCIVVVRVGADDPNSASSPEKFRLPKRELMMNAMRKRLGMITPSSNSVLEPVTYAMLTGVPGISAHFARFRVTEIALDAEALDQFDPSRMLPAADLLADAKV